MGEAARKLEDRPQGSPLKLAKAHDSRNDDIHTPAGFLIRFVASLVDGILVTVINLALITGVVFIFGKLAGPAALKAHSDLLTSLSSIPVILFYVIIPLKKNGQTLGKKMLGLRVVHDKKDSPLSYWQVIFRETIGKILSSILFIGYLIVPFNRKKKGFHDYLGATRVVRE